MSTRRRIGTLLMIVVLVVAGLLGGRGSLAAAEPGKISVPLSISEPSGIRRHEAPVTVGVPMPKGWVKDVSGLRVLNAKGEERPSQIRVLSRWLPRDDSAAWVLVDFQADAPANGKVVYRLVNDRPPAPLKTKLVAEKAGSAVTVTTGPLKFEVTAEGGFFNQAWLDMDGNGKFSDNERVILPSKPAGNVLFGKRGKAVGHVDGGSVEIEEAGPLRVVVKAAGAWPGGGGKQGLSYITRFFAYAGKPYVRVQHFLRNARPGTVAPPAKTFAGASLVARLNVTGPVRYAFGGEKTPSGTVGANQEYCLYQDSPGGERWKKRSHKEPKNNLTSDFRGWRLYRGASEKTAEGDFAGGWVNISTDTFGLVAGVRYFRENFPKGLSVRGDGTVSVDLWPVRYKRGHTLYTDHQKGHELVFAFHSGNAENASGLFKQFHRNLVAVPSLAWVRSTRAWPDFGDLIDRPRAKGSSMNYWEKAGLYGWPHFGGCSGDYAGGSFEPPTWRGQLYLESGGARGAWDWFEVNAWHWRDRSGVHVDNVDWVTVALKGKAREYYEKRVKPQWRAGRPYAWPHMDYEHMGSDEMVRYYLLTGDPGMRDALIADVEWAKWRHGRSGLWINRARKANPKGITRFENVDWRIKPKGPGRHDPGKRGTGDARSLGWQLRTYTNVYRALNREKDLSFAAYAAWCGMRNQDLVSGVYFGHRGDKSKKDIRKDPQTKPWMEAICAAGIFSYYEASRNQDALDSLYGFCRWLAAVTGKRGAPYIWSFVRQNSGNSGSSQRIPGTLALAYRYTGEREFLDAARRQVDALGWKKGQVRDGMVNAPVYWAEIAGLKTRDTTPPAAVRDLAVKALGDGKVEIAFTATGDDGKKGRAARYQVKHASLPMVENIPFLKKMKTWHPSTWMTAEQCNFWAAYNTDGAPDPLPAGQRERFTLSGIPKGTRWFALKVWDDAPNMSVMSNVVKIDVK